jgi:nicotinamidase-related amidase
MRILKEHTAVLIIDLQERLLPHMDLQEQLLERCRVLIEGLKILDIPMLVTQQYSKGLGATVPGISSKFSSFNPIEKTAFSCCDEGEFNKALIKLGKRNIIIAGIEAHVCVLQTVIDLLERNYQPVVIEDCVSSRNPADKATALRRMEGEGAMVSSSESVLFELLRYAGSETFKAISKLIR